MKKQTAERSEEYKAIAMDEKRWERKRRGKKQRRNWGRD